MDMNAQPTASKPRFYRRAKKLVAIFKQFGFSGLISGIRNFFLHSENRRVEHAYGLDIQSTADLKDLTVVGDNESDGFFYGATAITAIRLMLDQLDGEIEGATFVDYGAGKGAALLAAVHYPFSEVIGVEFARELHEIAEENIKRYDAPEQLCGRAFSVCADAAEFEVPSNDCVIYFGNPFGEELMRRVLSNIEASHRQHKQKIFVLFYQFLREGDETSADTGGLLDAAEFLKKRSIQPTGPFRAFMTEHINLRAYETRTD